MLIINANIITMEEENFANGYVLSKDGIITEVGNMSDLIAIPNDEVIDLEGNTLYPGFIDAHCHLGMWENGIGFEGDDANEEYDPITPQMRAIDAVNPSDFCFSEALKAGITTVLTGAGSANPIAGEWVAIKTKGRRIDDMIVLKNAGMKFALGENPKVTYSQKSQSPCTRMAVASLIREQLDKASRYLKNIRSFENESELSEPEYDAKCDALVPLLQRKTKAFFHAHRTDDIFTALRISAEYNLDAVIIHATSGHEIADILAKEKIPVIAGPIICDRGKPELSGLTTKNAGILSSNQVLTAICTDHPEIPIQYLPLSAGICIANGMEYNEALKAITINSAKICGIDDKVGSIKVGKHADFVAFDTDPLSVYAKPLFVVSGGQIER